MKHLGLIEQRYQVLDQLPDSLYSIVISLPHGDLLERVNGVLQWREALLKGDLPHHDELYWPEHRIKITLLKRLEAVNIASYCREQETLTDQVLLDICEGVVTAEEYFKIKPDGFIDKLTQQQTKRERESDFKNQDDGPVQDSKQQGQGRSNQINTLAKAKHSDAFTPDEHRTPTDNTRLVKSEPSIDLDEEGKADPLLPTKDEKNAWAPREVKNVSSLKTSASVSNIEVDLGKKWQDLISHWDEFSRSFSDSVGLSGRGWDLTSGQLATQDWQEILYYRKLIQPLPELKALVRRLGRKETIEEKGTYHTGQSKKQKRRRQGVPRVVMETGGLERSNEISRMLPVEYAKLGHQALKPLWLARYAERQLLCYQYQGLRFNKNGRQEVNYEEDINPEKQEIMGKGPFIICLDTSASMQGKPESIAKSLVLEILPMALKEQRPCYLYMFSGPDDVVEYELDLAKADLSDLLTVLRTSFHGGTYVVAPLLKAIQKQKQKVWNKTDILLISDGRFPMQDHVIEQINELKSSQGLRLHGLLLGDWRSPAMQAVCEPLYFFDSWGAVVSNK